MLYSARKQARKKFWRKGLKSSLDALSLIPIPGGSDLAPAREFRGPRFFVNNSLAATVEDSIATILAALDNDTLAEEVSVLLENALSSIDWHASVTASGTYNEYIAYISHAITLVCEAMGKEWMRQKLLFQKLNYLTELFVPELLYDDLKERVQASTTPDIPVLERHLTKVLHATTNRSTVRLHVQFPVARSNESLAEIACLPIARTGEGVWKMEVPRHVIYDNRPTKRTAASIDLDKDVCTHDESKMPLVCEALPEKTSMDSCVQSIIMSEGDVLSACPSEKLSSDPFKMTVSPGKYIIATSTDLPIVTECGGKLDDEGNLKSGTHMFIVSHGCQTRVGELTLNGATRPQGEDMSADVEHTVLLKSFDTTGFNWAWLSLPAAIVGKILLLLLAWCCRRRLFCRSCFAQGNSDEPDGEQVGNISELQEC